MCQLWILPIFTSIFCIFAVTIPYVIGVSNGNIPAWLPFISDGGAYPPEKSIFALFMNVSAVLTSIVVYIKHLQFMEFYENRKAGKACRRLSFTTLLLGFAASIGLCLVGNFSEIDALVVHSIGAIVTFLSAILYLCFITGLSFLRPRLCSLPIAFIRLGLTIFTIIALIFHEFTLFKVFVPSSTNETLNTGSAGYVPIFLNSTSPFYVNHIISTSTEWLLAFTIFAYFATFAEEFRKASLTLPSIKVHDDALISVTNSSRNQTKTEGIYEPIPDAV